MLMPPVEEIRRKRGNDAITKSPAAERARLTTVSRIQMCLTADSWIAWLSLDDRHDAWARYASVRPRAYPPLGVAANLSGLALASASTLV